MTNTETACFFEMAKAMGMGYDDQGKPLYMDNGVPRYFRPLEDDASAFRVQLHYNLALEVSEYGVCVRETPSNRIVNFKPFTRGGDSEHEVVVSRIAVFYAACKLIALHRTEAELRARYLSIGKKFDVDHADR